MSVARLCEAIVAYDTKVEIEVLTTTANGKKELPTPSGATEFVDGVAVTYFKRFTKDHSHFSPALFNNLRLQILGHSKNKSKRKNKRLIIHIHAWWNLVSILSCWLAKCYNIPVVLSPRGMVTNYTLGNKNAGLKSIIHNFIGKKLLKYCHIHATSEKEKEDILRLVNPKSIVVIPNLVNFPHSQNHKIGSHPSNEKILHLLFLSRIEEKKGLDLLFEALSEFAIKWKLTIAGSGEKDYVEALVKNAKNLNLTDRIIWFGQANDGEKFKLMAESDLMVLISYNENFANVVVESLSVGTAVLVSKEVGLSDYILKNELGWVSNLNKNDLKEKLRLSYFEIEKRNQIRQTAPAKIERDFDPSNLAQKYLEYYTRF